MAVRRIQCRAHPDGIFTVQVKRGRQPVSCKPEYPCDRAGEETPKQMKERTSPIGILQVGQERAEKAANAMMPSNPCLSPAKAAKERLTAVGWVCEGKAGCDEHYWASLTCSRDQETLIMNWLAVDDNDIQVTQQYAMEFEKPTANGYPPNRLHFNPDELTDSELVRMIQGMKITWWNTLGGSEETAIVGTNVTVAHVFRDGKEQDTKRMVTFVGRESGFRTFHVSALLKVG